MSGKQLNTKHPVKLNKILYKAHYRGTKETSHIITLFVENYLERIGERVMEHDIDQLMEFVDTDDALLFTGNCDQSSCTLTKQFYKFLVDIQWFKDNLA